MCVAKESILAGTNQAFPLYIAQSGLRSAGKPQRAAVEETFNNPIKGFGAPTDYPEGRSTQATGVGRDKILSSMPQLLTGPAGIYARHTVEPARTWRTICGAHSATRTTG